MIGYILFLSLPAVFLWLPWYARVATVNPWKSDHTDRLLVVFAPIGCLALLVGLIAYPEIAAPRFSTGQALALAAFGFAILGVACWMLPWLGLSPRDDVVERRNRAAAWAIGGGLLGVTLAFASAAVPWGTRLDDGQEALIAAFWRGVGSAVAMLTAWLILEMSTGMSEAITIDRDAGAALQLAGYLPASGQMIGLAVARLSTFGREPLWLAIAGPTLLLAVCVAIERSRRRGRRFGHVRPLDFATAIACLIGAGIWTQMCR